MFELQGGAVQRMVSMGSECHVLVVDCGHQVQRLPLLARAVASSRLIPCLPVAPDSSHDGFVLAVAREVVGAAANVLDPGFYCVLAIHTDHGVLWRRIAMLSRKKRGQVGSRVC